MQDKVKIKKSRPLLEMGEISRSYRALDADLESQKTAEELVQLYKDKLGILKEGTVVNDIPNNNPGIIISSECVREVIKQCGKGVSNSTITSNRYEIFKIMLGKNTTVEETYFLNHFTILIM